MSKKDQFKYRQIVEFQSGRVSRAETAKLLGMSMRNVSRLSSLVYRDGIEAVVHGNRGTAPANKTEKPNAPGKNTSNASSKGDKIPL